MNTIPTVEEFLIAEYFDLSNKNQTLKAKIAMKRAIQAHVEAALKAASENACITNDYGSSGDLVDVVDRESILNSYPLTNIK